MRRLFASVLEVLEIALVAVSAVFLIRGFLIQPFLVSGSSMVPSFSHGDYLLIDELSYRFRSPARGEVVVFHYPKDSSTYFIKRIIGMPGERVSIENGEVTILDNAASRRTVLAEPYLAYGTVTGGNAEYELGPDEYLVLGDNRSYSFDSRTWGSLKASDIVGLVRVRLWPLNDLRAFAAPQY
ncbi:signal peptidase I [Candidatus Parcubacteria bacterium]|nr:MAG: signal peptidase I [Candidatus Parcubacteria bacterium]